MREIVYRDETIKVLEATGYIDGYYWDMNAKIEFRGETYSLFDAGSGCGCIPCFSGITKCDFDRLYGEKQKKIVYNADEWIKFEFIIGLLMDYFIEFGAEEKWESYEDNDSKSHILVDGVEIK